MKRCPECQFIHPDSDEVCLFDQTPLRAIDDGEIDASTTPTSPPPPRKAAPSRSKRPAKRRNRKVLPLAAAAGLALGVSLFAIYYGVSHQISKSQQAQSYNYLKSEPVAASQAPVVVPAASPVAAASPVVSPTPTSRTSAGTQIGTAHSSVNTGPVSTSAHTTSTTPRKGAVILLTSGGKVEADEVWQTKDGVWYRREGVVTLLKRNRVKAIVGK